MTADEGVLGGHRRVWVIALVAAVVFTVLGTPRVAYAHNALVGTTPANGATVATAPAEVVLTFNEPALATGTKVLVTGPDGADVALGEPSLVDNTVRQELQPALPAGQYTVDWRVTSADGHPVNGTFTFRARTGAESQPKASAQASGSPSASASASASGDTSSAAPAAGDSGGAGGSSPLLWLLAVIPVGLAVWLGWRFSRRPG